MSSPKCPGSLKIAGGRDSPFLTLLTPVHSRQARLRVINARARAVLEPVIHFHVINAADDNGKDVVIVFVFTVPLYRVTNELCRDDITVVDSSCAATVYSYTHCIYIYIHILYER